MVKMDTGCASEHDPNVNLELHPPLDVQLHRPLAEQLLVHIHRASGMDSNGHSRERRDRAPSRRIPSPGWVHFSYQYDVQRCDCLH